MKTIEERQKDLNSEADTLLEELRACGGYKEVESEMMERIEKIYREYTEILKDGLKIEMSPVRKKLETGLRILRVKLSYRAFRFKWLLLKLGRLMLGMDV